MKARTNKRKAEASDLGVYVKKKGNGKPGWRSLEEIEKAKQKVKARK